MSFTGACHKNVPISPKVADSTNTTETIGGKPDGTSTASGGQVLPSSKPTAVDGQEPKPMSHISGVRRDLSRCDSLAVDVVQLPKYGVNTDRENDLGEVFNRFSLWYNVYLNI